MDITRNTPFGQVIDILKESGINSVIISTNDPEGFNKKRNALHRKKGLTVTQAVNAGFFNCANTAYNFIKSGKIKKDEWYENSNGVKVILRSYLLTLIN